MGLLLLEYITLAGSRVKGSSLVRDNVKSSMFLNPWYTFCQVSETFTFSMYIREHPLTTAGGGAKNSGKIYSVNLAIPPKKRVRDFAIPPHLVGVRFLDPPNEETY